MNKQTIEIMD